MVHDVAENILSFLRANATKTGHTYWLFKGGTNRRDPSLPLIGRVLAAKESRGALPL